MLFYCRFSDILNDCYSLNDHELKHFNKKLPIFTERRCYKGLFLLLMSYRQIWWKLFFSTYSLSELYLLAFRTSRLALLFMVSLSLCFPKVLDSSMNAIVASIEQSHGINYKAPIKKGLNKDNTVSLECIIANIYFKVGLPNVFSFFLKFNVATILSNFNFLQTDDPTEIPPQAQHSHVHYNCSLSKLCIEQKRSSCSISCTISCVKRFTQYI